MRHISRAAAIGVLLVFCVAGLGFAGGQSEAASEAEGAAADQIELRFSWWGGESRHNAILEVIEMFEEQNPGVTIKAEFSGWQGYIDKLRTQMAANSQPDLFYSGSNRTWGVLPEGGRADLNEFSGVIETSQLNDSQIEAVEEFADGRLVGLPRREQVLGGYLVNATLFEDLGIAIPEKTWSWEDLAELSQQVYDASDGEVYGVLDETGVAGYDSIGSRAWLMSHYGIPYVYDDGLGPTREQLVGYYEWWGSLRESGAASSAEVTVSADDNQNSPIVTGRVAMLPISIGSFARFQSNTEDELVFLPFPQGDYNNNEVGPGMLLSMSPHTEHPEMAAKFLNYMINDIEAGMVLKTELGIPSNAERRRALQEAGMDRNAEAVFSLHNWVVENLGTVKAVPTHPDYNELWTFRTTEEQRLAYDRADIDAVVDSIIGKAEQLDMAVPEDERSPLVAQQ